MHEAAAEASSLAFRVKLWMTSPLSEMSLNSSWTQLAAQTRLLRARARARVQDLLGPPHLRHCPLILSSLFNSSFFPQILLLLSAAIFSLFVSTLRGGGGRGGV